MILLRGLFEALEAERPEGWIPRGAVSVPASSLQAALREQGVEVAKADAQHLVQELARLGSAADLATSRRQIEDLGPVVAVLAAGLKERHG